MELLSASGIPGIVTLLLSLGALATATSAVINAKKGEDMQRRALQAGGLLTASLFVGTCAFFYWDAVLESPELTATGGNVDARMSARDAAQAAKFGPAAIALFGTPLPLFASVAAYYMSGRAKS